MDERDLLRKLAQDKIVAESGKPLDQVGKAATALLADLYVVGLAHGVTPEDWAWVTALPGACWDVSRDLARRRQTVIDSSRREDPRVTPPGPVAGLRPQPYPAAVPPPPQVRRGLSR